MRIEIHQAGGAESPFAPAASPSPGESPGGPPSPRITADLWLEFHEAFRSQRFAMTYRHDRPVLRILHAEATPLRPMRWIPDSGCLELTVKVLLAFETSDRPAMLAQDVVLRAHLGPADGVDADTPAVQLEGTTVDPADPCLVTGTLHVLPWRCRLRRPVHISITW